MANPTPPTELSGVTAGGSLNNKDLYQFGMAIHVLNAQDMPPIVARRTPRIGAHGQVIEPEFYDSRPLVMTGQMTADTPAALLSNVDAVKTYLETFRRGIPRRLRLLDPRQTDRYWHCYYDGVGIFSDPSPREEGTICDFAISLVAEPPFSHAISLSEQNYAAAADTFTSLTGLGTAEADPRIVFKGPATNPKLVLGDLLFLADFNLVTDFTDIEGATQTGTFSGTAAQKAALFSPSAGGYGWSFFANGAYQLTWTLKGPATAGAYFVIVEPGFAATSTGFKFVFNHHYDVNNSLRLFYSNDAGEKQWVFQKTYGGSSASVASAVQAFSSGDILLIGCTWGPNGLALYIDGVEEDTDANSNALSTAPDKLFLHNIGSNFSAASKIHKLVAWSRELSAAEHALIALDPDEQIRNRSQVLSWTGALDSGDWLDFNRVGNAYQGRKMDVSAGTLSTVWPDDGTIIPPLPPETAYIYHPNAIDTVHWLWQNRYL